MTYNKTVKLLFFGDTSDWNINDFSTQNIPKQIRDEIQAADLAIYNLEGPIGNPGIIFHENKFINFILNSTTKLLRKQQPEVFSTEKIMSLFKLCKRSLVTLANNHVKDCGKEGLQTTLQLLKKSNVLFIGAGENIQTANKPAIINIKGKKIAVFNVNNIGFQKGKFFLNIYGASAKSYGAGYRSFSELKKEISLIRRNNANILICLVLHAGKMNTDTPAQILAKKLSKINADIIVLHHAHKYKPLNSTRISYLGDFVFNFPGVFQDQRYGSYFKVELDREKVIKTKEVIYNFKKGFPKL